MRYMLSPLVLVFVAFLGSAAQAGWTVQWSTTAFNQRGNRLPSE